MNIKKLFAYLFVVIAMVFSVSPVTAQESVPEDSITFEMLDASGNVIGTATVPASQAKSTTLAVYFSSVSAAIDQVLAAAKGQVTSVTTALSSANSVRVTGTGASTAGGGASRN